MNTHLEIIFHGPYTLCTEKNDVLFDCPHASCEGLYLWAVRMSSGVYRVSYLGQTIRSFYERNKEHLIQTLGGNYQVCDPEAMVNGRLEVLWNGMWRKGTRDKLPEFLAKYERFAPIIKRSIFATKLFVAPLKIERRICKRIEGALAVAIKSDAEASSLLPKDIRYILKKENEEPIFVTIASEQFIEGLPKELYA